MAWREFLAVVGDLHAAAAAARRRLDQHGIADLLGGDQRLALAGDRALGARHAGNPKALGGQLGFDLVAHQADMLGLGADEGDAVLLENFGEAGVFGEEAIAGMHGVGAGDLAGREQGGNVEIGVARRGRADADRFVGELHMHRMGVGGRMHGDGRYAQLLRRAQNAQGDFAAIGDENFVDHLAASPIRSRARARHIRPAARPRRELRSRRPPSAPRCR